MVTLTSFSPQAALLCVVSAALAACSSGPQITRVQDLSESADAPYENILVIALFESFDARKQLEKYVVQQMAERGTKAVASTSLMNTTTPMTRQTFVAMVDQIDADGLLITQLVDLDSSMEVKDANPQTTRNIRPTYYFNVWSVEVTEYVEPPFLQTNNSVVLATQMYSVLTQDAVWAIESESEFVMQADQPRPYVFFLDEATAMVKRMASDGLIAP